MARDVIALPAITPWNVDWSKTVCTLRRGFGDKTAPDVVNIEQFGPSNTFQLLLFSDKLDSYRQGEPLYLRMGSNERVIVRYPLPGVRGKDRKPFISIASATLAYNWAQVAKAGSDESELAAVTPSGEAAVTSIGVEFRARIVTFQTGPLAEPFEALRSCTDDLVKSWGLDPAQQAKLKAAPTPLTKPGTWIRDFSYPSGMAMVGRQALVNFRLMIDAAGLPTTCEVQRSYNDKVFDEQTCKQIMAHARFSPALDEHGTATPSYHLNTVTWIIEQPVGRTGSRLP